MTPLRHEYDPRINHGRITWHRDPEFEGFMKHLLDHTLPDVIVETGTHMGWTAAWFAEHGRAPVYTVEIDAKYAEISRENLSIFKNVAVTHGDSPTFLRRIVRESMAIDDRPFFWLDAHWWPPIPLQEECSIIATLPRYIVVIDDFWLKDPDFGGDVFLSTLDGSDTVGKRNDIDYVSPMLGRRHWRPNYPAKEGYKGYALFTKGVQYVPPDTMKEET